MIRLMLGDQRTYTIPDIVRRTLPPESHLSQGPLQVNAPFTIYFLPQAQEADFALIQCSLAVPNVLGSELFLVEQRQTSQIAFLEFMGTQQGDREQLIPHARRVIEEIDYGGQACGFGQLWDDFRGIWDNYPTKRNPRNISLVSVRLCVTHGVACFFMGSAETFFHHDADRVASRSISRGMVQELVKGEDVAMEGWIEL
jgi:hypothetical protein